MASVMGVKDVDSQIREMEYLSRWFTAPEKEGHHIKDLLVFFVDHAVCLARNQNHMEILINCIYSILVMAISNGGAEAISTEDLLNMRILFLLKNSQERGFANIEKLNPLVSKCIYPNSRYHSWFNYWSSFSTF